MLPSRANERDKKSADLKVSFVQWTLLLNPREKENELFISVVVTSSSWLDVCYVLSVCFLRQITSIYSMARKSITKKHEVRFYFMPCRPTQYNYWFGCFFFSLLQNKFTLLKLCVDCQTKQTQNVCWVWVVWMCSKWDFNVCTFQIAKHHTQLAFISTKRK